MRKDFFTTAGFLLMIAFVAISVIFGVRTGIVYNSFWTGCEVGGLGILGTVFFAVGISQLTHYNTSSAICRVLYVTSILGLIVFGVTLVAEMLSDGLSAINISGSVLMTGFLIGAGMFLVPIILLAMYFGCKWLIAYVKNHKKFSALTVTLMAAICIGDYLATSSLSAACSAGLVFFFYWWAIRVFVYAWFRVENEKECKYWRIGFALVITFLGCGILAILSEVFVHLPFLHETFTWIAYHVGQVAMFGFLGYLAVILFATLASKILVLSK